jgi:sulfopyruvate decarboxylase alpha subunit
MTTTPWQDGVYAALKKAGIRQIAYVPDAGHSRLIELAHADNDMSVVVCTTEEEGVALAAGAHLGGQRACLLMQSSGVGNTINMVGLPTTMRAPFLTLITMRGEWGEFNGWQVPMGQATEPVLRAMGVTVKRAETKEEVVDMVAASAALAFGSLIPVAVLFSQKLIGAKVFVKPEGK